MQKEFGCFGEIRWVTPPLKWLGEVVAALSLRAGGESAPPYDSLNLGRSTEDTLHTVERNERRFRSALGLPSPPARARLAHGSELARVERPGTYGPIDGLLTDRPRLPLWLTVADCVPVFLAVGDWIGLLHAGWRPIAAGAVEGIVSSLADASTLPPEGVRVWIGPGIGVCCYPVGPEVAERFDASVLFEREGATHLDLSRAIRGRLERAGVASGSIADSGLCTACHPELFFSYRRDGRRTGRMAAVCWRA